MIITINPPTYNKRSGEIDCPGCSARLGYQVEDLQPVPPPYIRGGQMNASQMVEVVEWKPVTVRKCRWFITCPNCGSTIEVTGAA